MFYCEASWFCFSVDVLCNFCCWTFAGRKEKFSLSLSFLFLSLSPSLILTGLTVQASSNPQDEWQHLSSLSPQLLSCALLLLPSSSLLLSLWLTTALVKSLHPLLPVSGWDEWKKKQWADQKSVFLLENTVIFSSSATQWMFPLRKWTLCDSEDGDFLF